jgi:protein-S-isoprenylcysteine O-methyltransferase Ste14
VEKLVPPTAYRLTYNIVATGLLGFLWVASDGPYPVLWDLQGLPALSLRVIQACALLLFLVALRPIDLRHFVGWRQLHGDTRERHGLVTHGAYALCRHPIYLSVCVFFSAWPHMDLRTGIIAIWLWAYAAIGSLLEERRLELQFGQTYRHYRETCPRLLPLHWKRRRKA